MEHIPGQALRMDAHQWRLARQDIAHYQYRRFLYAAGKMPFKAKDSKLAKPRRKLGLGGLFDTNCGRGYQVGRSFHD